MPSLLGVDWAGVLRVITDPSRSISTKRLPFSITAEAASPFGAYTAQDVSREGGRGAADASVDKDTNIKAS